MTNIKVKAIKEEFTDCFFVGEESHEINNIISINDAGGKQLGSYISWISDKYLSSIKQPLNLGLLILTKKGYEFLKDNKCNFLISDNPRATFAKLTSIYFGKKVSPAIETTSIIDSTSFLGKNIYIGHNVVIERDCIIGDNCVIMHNSVIMANTIIGNNVTIGCNCTIGNYGFGYEKNDEGDYQLMTHLGQVIIKDFVEIHNNTCIDKGVLGATVISENVKIDNLVHVAHGVIIERNSLIIANAMLGGSCIIGQDSWIAPSTSIKNKINVSKNTLTGIGAVVLKEFGTGKTLIGNPATTMEEYKEWSIKRKKLMTND